jgi:hypothetical protein
MNHQPFEDWLLEDEHLSVQQERELQIHIRSCTSCAAIADSNLALHSRRLIAPAPGFSARFQPRLVAWRQEQLRRQALGTIILVLAGIALLYTLAGPAMLEAVRSPAAWFREITVYIVALLTFARVLGQVGGVLLRNLPDLMPAAGWWAMLTGACVLATLWIFTIRRLARAPQGV